MREPVRVTLEGDDDAESVRIHDDEGEVAAGGATFRFRIEGDGPDDSGAATDSADPDGDDPRRIAPLEDVPTDGTLRCEALNGSYGTELILRREGESVSAWRNSCPHRPEVRLDRGGGAIVRGDQFVCHEHGARFECDDGLCTAGPCRGDVLERFAVSVRDGAVYLADERFDACRRLD
ncbi:Rieske (2Fe-2S) protein [Natrialbaceae archaeon GCM10025810]|uniref:Rieske (2Fe-2S) protein n=1 Tax=Halovalidus salilacus TaxID=3075124 RepID=UPI00360CE0AA